MTGHGQPATPQIGCQLVQVEAGLEAEDVWGRPSRGKAGRGQLLAATAAELGAQRAAGILQHAVEQELEPGPGIPRLAARWAVQRKRVPVVP